MVSFDIKTRVQTNAKLFQMDADKAEVRVESAEFGVDWSKNINFFIAKLSQVEALAQLR